MNRTHLVLKIVGVALAVIVVTSYLAGTLLFLSWRMNPQSVTPLTWLSYAYYYGDEPGVGARLRLCAGLALVLVAGCALTLLWPRKRAQHGDARFATREEIAQEGLLGEQGIILGKLGSRYLMLDGQQGVALAAPPRAGKGAGVVIPNALNWPGSLVCLDIKRENWTVTAGYRKACGQAVHLFEPFAEDGRTARWNPFFYVSDVPELRINDLQRISDMLYPDPRALDPFWHEAARPFFIGMALYVFETPSLPCTIGEVLRQAMAGEEESFTQHWRRVIEERESQGRPLSAECVRLICEVINLESKTASSIRKSCTAKLSLWLNPILDAATSGNDFDLRDLRRTPQSIYVGVNPEDLHRLRPVLDLFFQQAIGLQTRELPEHNPALAHQVLMLLDEFTALGPIPIIAESIAYLPGYNVRVILVIQALSQLRDKYGADVAETMMKSLGARILFTPKDFADAKEISEELGYQTIKVRSVSKPIWDLSSGSGKRGRNATESDQRRALMLPQEVKELPADKAFIFYERLRPFICTRIRYFQDRVFRKRLLPAPPRPPAIEIKPAPPIERAPRQAAGSEGLRSATFLDIDRLHQLQVKDVVVDTAAVTPVLQKLEAASEPVTSDQYRGFAAQFLNTVKVAGAHG